PNGRQSNRFQASATAILKEQCPAAVIKPENSEKESHVADARGDKRFFCRSRSARALDPETDQQIRRESDELPKNKEEKQTVSDDHAQHRAGKKRQVSKKPTEIFVFGHVADAENENAETDQRDHHQHRGRKRIENEPDAQNLFPESEPRKILDRAEAVRMQRGHKREDRHRQGADLSENRDRGGCPPGRFSESQNQD